MTKPENRPVGLGVAATLLLIVAMVAVYLLSQYFGADAWYKLGNYFGSVIGWCFLLAVGFKAWGRPLEPARLVIASVLCGLVLSGLGFYREVQEARTIYRTLNPESAVDPAEISLATHGRHAPMLKWEVEQRVKFDALLSEISEESAALTIPAVFDPTVMGRRNEIPKHREALVIYQQFATNARDAILGRIEVMEQEGMQRFPEAFSGPDYVKNRLVVRKSWDAIWGAELEMSGIALEALALMESNGYEVDTRGVFIFPDDATAEKFNALRARAHAAAEQHADAERMMQQRLRELEARRPDWVK